MLHDQVLRTFAAGLQGKGLIVIWTLRRGAAAKETSLGTTWKSCCQKTGTPEQCRCLEQMAGHSHPEIEKITFPVQSRDRNTSRKPAQILFPSLQFIPAMSTFATLGWHHSLGCIWPLTQLNTLSLNPTAISRAGQAGHR